MARPYASEMAKLPETFDWATSADIEMLRRAVRTAGLSPLRAIGSGGSLTAAHALAAFHQQHTGQMAAVATPLEVVDEPLKSGISHWLLSAGGGNVDILAAAQTLIPREPRQLAILCGREDSPLTELGKTHAFTDLLIFPPPAGKDGFLATNSLLAFTALLARAYATLLHGPVQWRPGPARRRRLHLDLTPDAHLAFQAEPGPPPPHSQTEAPDHELARV